MRQTPDNKRHIPVLYFIFLACVLTAWLYYVLRLPSLQFIAERRKAMLTMLAGSFVAGSSPEGSAAISYPIFTLLLKIAPATARNFSFAIQSIGMTGATLMIIGLRVKVELNYIKFVTLGGVFGLVFGTYFIVPLISPVIAKLFFVSLWLSFGIILWWQNLHKERVVFNCIQNFNRNDVIRLIIFGMAGGVISSIFGTGINIFTYCLMTIYYKISEKVATPSSVIIITIETILGFSLHAALLKDFSDESFKLWISCIPVVIFFAPFGAFVVSKLPRLSIAKILYSILVIQFVGAMFVIKPNTGEIFLCVITIVSGLSLFYYLARLKRVENKSA